MERQDKENCKHTSSWINREYPEFGRDEGIKFADQRHTTRLVYRLTLVLLWFWVGNGVLCTRTAWSPPRMRK